MYEGPVPVIRIDKTGATTASRAERPDGVRQGDVPMSGGWIQRYMKLTEFLGSVLGPDYEVVLHDLGDADKSIIAIANGHVSGRTIGAPLTSVALQSIINHSYETQDYRLNYVGVAGSKLLRSSTFFVKDEEGRLVGMLCINFDDSRYRELSDRILKLRHPDVFVETNFAYNEEAAAVRAAPPPTEVSESFPNSLTELTDHLLDEELRSREANGERLSHRDKLALVEILNDKGIFMMKGAVKYVAEKLGCSQTTIYRYLNRMNGGSESSSEA